MPQPIARIITDIALDREFDYRIPDHLRGLVQVGSVVQIPFGRRHVRGFVTALRDTSPFPDLKALHSVVDAPPLFDEPMLRLARWLADYYMAPFELAIAAILPAPVRREGAKFKEQLVVRPRPDAAPTPAELAALTTRSPKQAAAWQHLQQTPEQTAAALMAATGVGLPGLRSLAAKGWLTLEKGVIRRNPHERLHVLPTQPPPLMPEQIAAMAAIHEEMTAAKPRVVLLHGVTGSGKTEVYLAAIQAALDAGKGAIALVPEIALTPQTMERFRGRFGETVAVLHSHLSDGERHDEWRRIAAGQARVVVGARSALFAPVRPLGLVVVDEEHEPAYKQDEAPRYNARDVAVMRGHLEGCAVVLGSATPSLESYRHASAGKYRLVNMTQRVDERVMPMVRVVDLRGEAEKAGGARLISPDLVEAIRQRLAQGEQTILFLNRRGYATTVVCPLCGHTETCPNCSVKMTYHKAAELLLCHVCGHTSGVPARCSAPQCGAPNIKMAGVGTQRVEAAVRRIFPRARVARMDSDATGAKDAHAQILGKFRQCQIDILIGTQMIAKGLDFPNVTLVGVIYADLSLQMPDFRAAERTFQLLTQVAGRAGRGDVPGEVLIQTYTPFHPAVQSSRRADYATFYDQEIEMRRELNYPPFSRLTSVLFRGLDEASVNAAAKDFAAQLPRYLPAGVRLLGPNPAPLARANKQFRTHFLLFGKNIRDYAPALRKMLALFKPPKGVAIAINVDALSIM